MFSFTLVQARFWDVACRGTLGICVRVWEKGVDLVMCYEGTPQQLRKDREDMFCAASIRVGLDLCPIADCTGFFSLLGFSYLCPICHANSAVLMSFKWGSTFCIGSQCQPGGGCPAEPGARQGVGRHGLGELLQLQPAVSHRRDRSRGKKKRCGFKEELHDNCLPVNGSFQKTPASCEMVLLLTWPWPACVQLVQVKVWGHISRSCFTAVHLWCKK